ncbi:MAG TPA: DUF3618 domain-containing protein [Gammaproteobacteria bacterium]|nr:DUF3618 domain-containing protein [Gammaproteobacteria bacterium]
MKPTLDADSTRYAEHSDSDDRDPAALERDIDTTRADVRATLAALERRLSFDRLVEMTVGRIRERGGEFAGNLTDTATQNPMPVLLTSIGLGWMMLMSRRGNGASQPSRARARAAEAADSVSGAAERFGERFSGAKDRFGEQVSGAAHGASERMHEAGSRLHEAVESSRQTLGATAESMRDNASRMASATREQMSYATDRIDQLLHEQPLLLGALGLAAGALIGALLPTSEAEGRLLGEARDKAVKNVAQKSRTLYETARDNAAQFAAPGGRDEDASSERPSRPH